MFSVHIAYYFEISIKNIIANLIIFPITLFHFQVSNKSTPGEKKLLPRVDWDNIDYA